MSIFSSIGTALPFLLQTIPAVTAGLGGVDTSAQKKINKSMEPLINQQIMLSKAQYDPNSELYKNIYKQESDFGKQNIADVIAEISRQNRKLSMLGRNPLLDQERGGESVFRNLIKGQQDVGNNARMNTLARLSSGASGINNAAGMYSQLFGNYGDLSKTNYQNKIRSAKSYYSIGDMLKNLFNNQSGEEVIYWNQ